MVRLTVNGRAVAVEAPPETPLLWVLRDHLDLTGTKFGCGAGLCGACTVLLGTSPVRSCRVAVGMVTEPVVTIEGVYAEASAGALAPLARRLREAWIAEQAGQCGYCLPGLVIAGVGLLADRPDPSDDEIDRGITNLCPCGSFPQVRRAIRRAAAG